MRALLRLLSPYHDVAPPAERRALPRATCALAAPATLVFAIWALLPHHPGAHVVGTLACMAVIGTLATLGHRHERLTPVHVSLLLVGDTALIALATALSGSPLTPMPLFFMWAIPLAFAYFGLPHAVLQACFVGVAYGVVLATVDDADPIASATAWTGVMTTLLAVGFSIRRLMLRVREADAQYRRAFEDSAIPTALCDLDHRFVQVNDALCRFLGRSRGELIGSRPEAWTDPADMEATRAFIADRGDRVLEKRYRHADGTTVWGRVHRSPVYDARGRVLYRQTQIEDITARRRADNERRAAAATLARRARLSDVSAELGRLAVELSDPAELMRRATELVGTCLDASACVVAESVPDGTFRIAASTSPDAALRPGTIMRSAEGGLAGLALSRREPVAVDDFAARPGLDPAGAMAGQRIGAVLACGLRRPGETLGVVGAFTEERRQWAPEEVQFLAVVAAVLASALERSRAEAAAHRRATHDALTGLPNRELLLDRLSHALVRARRDGAPPAVLLLDLDGFKVVNDSLGHHAGDELLRTIAPRLTEAVRTSDTVARLGGDEFVVLADGIASVDAALDVAARVERALRLPVRIGETEHHVSASVGIAIGRPRSDPDELLRDADAAMYHAKRRGRGRVELFDEPMRDAAIRRMALEQDLRRALEGGDELRLEFQPVVDLRTGRVRSCEALTRWTHPEHGPIAPDEFIGVAEDSGLILPMGRWVLRAACEEAMRWPADVGLAVNLSARQVGDPELCRHVHEALAQTGMTPDRLTLEITESVLLEEADWAMRTLVALRAMGIRLALDDFGTGYSSLSYLRRFPLDALKVDRAFVRGLGDDPQAAPLVEAVVTMARALGLAVVAEGIENEEQRARVAGFGDVLGQGWLLGRPQGAAATRERLAAATIAA